jgi:hypothetical protein
VPVPARAPGVRRLGASGLASGSPGAPGRLGKV